MRTYDPPRLAVSDVGRKHPGVRTAVTNAGLRAHPVRPLVLLVIAAIIAGVIPLLS
jgi:hypothetical protein